MNGGGRPPRSPVHGAAPLPHGGVRGAAAQRGDGAAPPAHRALPAAPQRLRVPLPGRLPGAPGAGAPANLRPAPALPAGQGQAGRQAPAAAPGAAAARAPSAGRRRRGKRRQDRSQRPGRRDGERRAARPQQHVDRGKGPARSRSGAVGGSRRSAWSCPAGTVTSPLELAAEGEREEGEGAPAAGAMACGGRAEVGAALRSAGVGSVTTSQLVRAARSSALSPLCAERVRKNCCLLR